MRRRRKVRLLLAEPTARHASGSEADSGRIDEFFKAILASKALRSDERKEFEAAARQSAEEHTLLAELQRAAAQQARKVYKCTVCGLEFVGILSFGEHNESTAHNRNQDSSW
jgi:rubrerythrin